MLQITLASHQRTYRLKYERHNLLILCETISMQDDCNVRILTGMINTKIRYQS